MSTDEKSTTGALSDVKVLDLSNFLAAPMCAMFMADFGAQVIKIEKPALGCITRSSIAVKSLSRLIYEPPSGSKS
jgi:crotonobetainyl-CoA:carnitine CoA-transferase CaiB-like acyl-CoA transferase